MPGSARHAPSSSASTPPAVRLRVEAALLGGGADDEPAVARAARDRPSAPTRRGAAAAPPGPCAAPASGPSPAAPAACCRRARRSAPDHAPAASTTASAGVTRRRQRARRRRGRPRCRSHRRRCARAACRRRPGKRGAARRDQQAVVDLMIGRAEDRGGEIGMKMRLALARRARRQPFERDAVLALKIVSEAKLRRVVAGERDHQRAFAAQPDAHARPPARARRRSPATIPGCARLSARRSSSPGSSLDAGGQHAGRRPARAAPGLVALEHRRPRARAGQTPADRQGRSRRRRRWRRCCGRSR